MKLLKDILLYSLFLLSGIALFWWQYKDLDWEKLKHGLAITNYFWVGVAIFLGLLSQVSRAIRWKMLIEPLGYNPKVSNIFLSVLIMYFTNLLVPRAGEVARCTILAKYEKIPASKLIGTMIVERIADTLVMMGLAVIILGINISVFKRFLVLNPEVNAKLFRLLSLTNILLGLAAIALLVIIFLLVKPFKKGLLSEKIKRVKTGLKEGVKSILLLENKWYFIGHTLFIFLMWLLMLYVVFLAYPPTSHLTIWAGMFTFLMGGLAMFAPVSGGIGAWHFMVIESIFLYGIDRDNGKIFALIAHSSTNLIYIIFGSAALILLPIMNRRLAQKKQQDVIK
jgi:glycosyltransferase 2 family protein